MRIDDVVQFVVAGGFRFVHVMIESFPDDAATQNLIARLRWFETDMGVVVRVGMDVSPFADLIIVLVRSVDGDGVLFRDMTFPGRASIIVRVKDLGG